MYVGNLFPRIKYLKASFLPVSIGSSGVLKILSPHGQNHGKKFQIIKELGTLCSNVCLRIFEVTFGVMHLRPAEYSTVQFSGLPPNISHRGNARS